MPERVLVTGAGGFIGHHLANRLAAKGFWVRGADLKAPEYGHSQAHEFHAVDLRDAAACKAAVKGVQRVYHLAADMGGIGYITAAHAGIARNDTLMNVHMLDAAHEAKVQRFFYASSACVYAHGKQTSPDVPALREEDAWPAQPEEGYGLEKLFAEKLCQYYREDLGLETRVARFHNVYGPLGTYDGGKEKAPAALSRKIALAKDGDTLEVWGDGRQTRSFMYIDDCVEGIQRIMDSDVTEPLNLGTAELVTVDGLVDLISGIAGKRLVKRHDVSKPQGVRGRNSDNTRIRTLLGWEPTTPLETGLRPTYAWVHDQLRAAGRLPKA